MTADESKETSTTGAMKSAIIAVVNSVADVR